MSTPLPGVAGAPPAAGMSTPLPGVAGAPPAAGMSTPLPGVAGAPPAAGMSTPLPGVAGAPPAAGMSTPLPGVAGAPPAAGMSTPLFGVAAAATAPGIGQVLAGIAVQAVQFTPCAYMPALTPTKRAAVTTVKRLIFILYTPFLSYLNIQKYTSDFWHLSSYNVPKILLSRNLADSRHNPCQVLEVGRNDYLGRLPVGGLLQGFQAPQLDDRRIGG